MELYTPRFVLKEINKYSDEILTKTHRTRQEFLEIIKIINELVDVIPRKDVENNLKLAEEISLDSDDVMYFTLELNCPIWSNDKILKMQDNVKIYSTEDLIKKFG